MLQLIDQDEVVGINSHKEIMRSYKYELKPTKKQEVSLNKTLSTCRHLYNLGLEQRKKSYEKGGWSINYSDQQDQLPELRQKCAEYQDVYTDVLQNVLRRVETSYDNFFRRVKNNNSDSGTKEKPGFPRFGYGCHIVNKSGDKDEKGNILRLSKIDDIKFIKHRIIGNGSPYLIKTVTVKREIDKFFVTFVAETYSEISSPRQYTNIEELNNKSVGTDMGLSNLATLSNGKIIEPPEYLRESAKKLTKHQRRLSKKKRYEKEIEIVDKKTKKKTTKKIKINSKNREKERIKVVKIHRKIVNQRKNFNHEVSRTLINNFDLISFEKLSIQNMGKNHDLAKSISDASWYQLQMFTSYKAEWAGKIVEFVDPKNTSQLCSGCGNKEHLELSDRIFKCSKCGLEIDRDLNASINIRNRSIEYQRLLKDIELIKNKELTPATGGGACGESNRNSEKQETMSDKDRVNIENMSIQAPPFRAG